MRFRNIASISGRNYASCEINLHCRVSSVRKCSAPYRIFYFVLFHFNF